MSLDLSRYDAVDWDPEDQEDGNWQHCARAEHLGPRPDRVVDGLLSYEPVELKMRVDAEFSLVGPDSTSSLWVVVFDTSHKRGDWLRPVTGWAATLGARQRWRKGRVGGTVRTWLNG